MPDKETIEKAQQDKREGKAPSTQAGEFVKEEMEHIREGKHGARNAQQAIAIGLSKARRAGVDLKPPKKGEASEKTRKSAGSAYKKGQKGEPVSKKRSAASHKALSKQAKSAAKKRSASDRSTAAKKAARTKGPAKRSAAAKKAARTRARKK